MGKLRSPQTGPNIRLIFGDSKGHRKKGLFSASETPSSLRLHGVIELTEEGADKSRTDKGRTADKGRTVPFPQIGLLSSFHTIILDNIELGVEDYLISTQTAQERDYNQEKRNHTLTPIRHSTKILPSVGTLPIFNLLCQGTLPMRLKAQPPHPL